MEKIECYACEYYSIDKTTNKIVSIHWFSSKNQRDNWIHKRNICNKKHRSGFYREKQLHHIERMTIPNKEVEILLKNDLVLKETVVRHYLLNKNELRKERKNILVSY